MQVLLYTYYSMLSTGVTAHNLPYLYWNIIKLWSKVGNTTNRHKGDFILYNRDINTKFSVLVGKHFLQAGIWHIDDLYNKVEK